MSPDTNSGYLYVLIHSALPNYYKLGQTTKHPIERLKSHNNDKTRILGKLAQLTNKPWQMLYYVPVNNPRKAESATLWYDVLPRWDNLELNNGEVISAIEDMIKSPYLDKERYKYLLETELLYYDYKAMIITIKKEWEGEGVVEECEKMMLKVKEERNKNDNRRKYYD